MRQRRPGHEPLPARAAKRACGAVSGGPGKPGLQTEPEDRVGEEGSVPRSAPGGCGEGPAWPRRVCRRDLEAGRGISRPAQPRPGRVLLGCPGGSCKGDKESREWEEGTSRAAAPQRTRARGAGEARGEGAAAPRRAHKGGRRRWGGSALTGRADAVHARGPAAGAGGRGRHYHASRTGSEFRARSALWWGPRRRSGSCALLSRAGPLRGRAPACSGRLRAAPLPHQLRPGARGGRDSARPAPDQRRGLGLARPPGCGVAGGRARPPAGWLPGLPPAALCSRQRSCPLKLFGTLRRAVDCRGPRLFLKGGSRLNASARRSPARQTSKPCAGTEGRLGRKGLGVSPSSGARLGAKPGGVQRVLSCPHFTTRNHEDLIITQGVTDDHCAHFTVEQTEAPKAEVTCSKSQNFQDRG
uniref:translation initiation factor IF-2-like n=1 Tax=Callithrix jacchus TaxID=9483 RepID=UPI0023DD0D2D|nr:translation initiation factor IF-2-like [Callithrix jacchus]